MPMFILTAPFLGPCCEHAPPVERACCYGIKRSKFPGFVLFLLLLTRSSRSSLKDTLGCAPQVPVARLHGPMGCPYPAPPFPSRELISCRQFYALMEFELQLG